MTKLQESLIILNHLSQQIHKTYLICNKYGVVSTKYQKAALEMCKHFEFRDLGIVNDTNHKIVDYITEQTNELYYLIYEAIAKGIIDMCSFYDEYNNYFTPSITDNSIFCGKISKIKLENKILINSIDWKRIKDIRNNVLAHNIRSKKNSKEIAINNIINYYEFSKNILDCAKKFEVIINVFESIENEFESELNIK